MRYACLTARHHEGFALFDSKASDFSSVASPATRDLVAEYVESRRRANIGVGQKLSTARGRTAYVPLHTTTDRKRPPPASATG
jgi:alpha-L-fucosidase